MDESENSVWCEACQGWVHSKKECSGIKKTMFNVLGKNDAYTCPGCAYEIKKFKSEIGLPVDQVKNDLVEAKQLIGELEARNKQLLLDLNEKEVRLIAIMEEMEKQRHGEWSSVKPGKCAGQVGLDNLRKIPPLRTSNKFEVLNGEKLGSNRPYSNECEGNGEGGSREASVNEERVAERAEGSNFANTGMYVKKKTKRRPRPRPIKKPKNVIFVADSQGRNCGGILSDNLYKESQWGAQALILPGATNTQVIDVATEKARNLSSNDCLVILGGVNEVTTDSIIEVESKLNNLGLALKSHKSPPPVVILETPNRYDLDNNAQIKSQNRLLKEKCVEYKWTYLATNCMLDRDCYTKHGLHMNKEGKKTLCNLVLSLVHSFSGPIKEVAKNDVVIQETRVT